MLIELAADIAKISFFIACAYALVIAFAWRRRPQWNAPLAKRRLAVLGVLTLSVGGVKVIEDVVAKESGPVDEAILWFVREHVPSALSGFFAAVTLSGSAMVLAPAAGLAALSLLIAGRRFEALLLGASSITATLVVWGMKAISRLVLGVHWPSDVLAAICLGAFIPLLISVANDLRHEHSRSE